jgi:hypothetical protein
MLPAAVLLVQLLLLGPESSTTSIGGEQEGGGRGGSRSVGDAAGDGIPKRAARSPAGAATAEQWEQQEQQARGSGQRVASRLHYELGAAYTFEFELSVQSDGFGGLNPLRQNERMKARCDLTAWPYSDSEWLLELDVYEMRQHTIRSDGYEHPLPDVGDHRLARHPFYAVQDHGGAISRVFYPETEELEMVNLKKGYMSMFHTRASLFADGGPASARAEEEDEHGNHTVKYGHELHAHKQVIHREKDHNLTRYMRSNTHRPEETKLLDASEVREVSRHEMHHSGQVHTATVEHTIRLDHTQPALTERANGGMAYELRASVDSVRTMKLLGTTRSQGEDKDGGEAGVARAQKRVHGLREDTPFPVEEDHSAEWREFTDQQPESLDEALDCFERTEKNATCVVRLLRVIKQDNSSLDHLYGDDGAADKLSPTIQALLIDAVPIVGSRLPQLWLASVLQTGTTNYTELPSDVPDARRDRLRRALTATHQIKEPIAEIMDVIRTLSVTDTPLGQAAILALGTLARQVCHHESEAIFMDLSSRLERLRHSNATANIEKMNTLLRALGNHGDERLLGIMPWFHVHDCISIRETAAHVLRRVRTPEAEERLLWVLRNDPNHTAQSMAVLALQNSERENSDEVVREIEDMLWTEDVMHEALEERLFKHLEFEAPHKVDGCRDARKAAVRRRQLQEELEVAGICVCGACGGCPTSCYSDGPNGTACASVTGEALTENSTACERIEGCIYHAVSHHMPPAEAGACPDGSPPIPCNTPGDISLTLIDVYLGKSLEFGAPIGHADMGAQLALSSSNFARLRISVFGGEFEVNMLTEVGIDAHAFGHKMTVLGGVVAFNVGASYKNSLASQLAGMANTGALPRPFVALCDTVLT